MNKSYRLTWKRRKAMIFAEIESVRPWKNVDKKIQAENDIYEKALNDVINKIQNL